MKKCIICKKEIHPKRLEILPNTTKYVSCSSTNKKAGVTVALGTGDNIYNETIIMEHDEFVKYKEVESKFYKTSFDEIPLELSETQLPVEKTEDEDDALDFSNIGE